MFSEKIFRKRGFIKWRIIIFVQRNFYQKREIKTNKTILLWVQKMKMWVWTNILILHYIAHSIFVCLKSLSIISLCLYGTFFKCLSHIRWPLCSDTKMLKQRNTAPCLSRFPCSGCAFGDSFVVLCWWRLGRGTVRVHCGLWVWAQAEERGRDHDT